MSGYREGVFPMGYPGRSLISWHQPPERAILPLDELHISRSLWRTLRKGGFQVTFDQCFAAVMRGCAGRRSTWITPAIVRVYQQLHGMGLAHSVEVWIGEELAAGLYGVHIGGAFFAESKFHHVSGMSKVALVHLAWRLKECGFVLLDVQYLTAHLAQFGVVGIPDDAYRVLLAEALSKQCQFP